MAVNTITHNTFYAGISPFQKLSNIDGKSQARFIKNMNIHEDPSYITLMPGLSKVSDSVVTNLVTWADDGQPFDTNRYFYDQAGNLYKETSGGAWSNIRTVSGGAGQGLLVFDDYLYYSTSTTIGRYGRLSGSPSFNDDFLSDGTTNIDQENITASGQTYTTPTSISETSTNLLSFTPLRDPLKAVIIKVASKGTGNWTVTIHDSNNNSIGTATVSNASLTNSAANTFTFTTPLRMIIGNTYHIHVTSTVADGTVTTGTTSDLSTAYYQTLFGILVADSNWHPIKNHLNLMCVGNERYLAVWDEATYNPNRLTFAAGFKVRSMTIQKEYLVIATWKGSSIDAVEEGRLYYWDGISTTFNYYENVNLGLPNAIHTSKNRLFGIYGSSGTMHLFNEPFKKIQDPPYLGRGKKVEVYPGAITEWQSKTYIGIAGSTDDGTGLSQGVYEWGNQQDDLPEVLNYAFTISTGTTQSTEVSIGMVKAFGKDLYVSWKDAATYGIDKVSKTSNAAANGSYEQLIYDGGNPQKNMLPQKIVITFLPLATGESVTPKYRLDRASSWTLGTDINTVGSTRAELLLDVQGRANEIEYGFDVASSNGTYPKITGVFFMSDDLSDETPES